MLALVGRIASNREVRQWGHGVEAHVAGSAGVSQISGGIRNLVEGD